MYNLTSISVCLETMRQRSWYQGVKKNEVGYLSYPHTFFPRYFIGINSYVRGMN